MKIDLRRLEIISKIKIPQKKETTINQDIEDIISYTEIIKKNHQETIETNTFQEETKYRTPAQNQLELERNSEKAIIFNNAPQKKYDYFQVPALIERKI